MYSGSAMPFKYIRECGKQGKMGLQMMAVVAEGDRERVFLNPDMDQQSAAAKAVPKWMPDILLPDRALGIQTQLYGFDNFSLLFTKRQLTALGCLTEIVSELGEELAETDAEEALRLYLAHLIAKLADLSNSLCRWEPNAQCPRQLFGRQTIQMVWDFAEGNPLGSSSGSLEVVTRGITNAMHGELFNFPRDISGIARQIDARHFNTFQSHSVIATDPPYYDNIGYAHLSDFFYGWHRHGLQSL